MYDIVDIQPLKAYFTLKLHRGFLPALYRVIVVCRVVTDGIEAVGVGPSVQADYVIDILTKAIVVKTVPKTGSRLIAKIAYCLATIVSSTQGRFHCLRDAPDSMHMTL